MRRGGVGDGPPSPAAHTFGFGAAVKPATPDAASSAAPSTSRTRLSAVYLACVHVAAKNIDTVPYRRLLATMLANLYGVPAIPPAAAASLELDVLVGLGWRLGPYFTLPGMD